MKRVIVGSVNIQLQMNFVDMQQCSTENDGYRHILLTIDLFSKYAYSKPLKTKQGPSVVLAIKEMRIDYKIKNYK